jgi:phage shock protein C
VAKKTAKRKPKVTRKPTRKAAKPAHRTAKSRSNAPAMRVRPAKRLYRSGNDRILGGVCGGIAEFYGLDPTVIRILWILLTLVYGLGILLYLALWIVMPRNPNHDWGTRKKAKRK